MDPQKARDLQSRVEAEQRRMAQPIDLESLIAEGILERDSSTWYVVLDNARLPEHVTAQATAVEASNDGSPLRIQLRPPRKQR